MGPTTVFRPSNPGAGPARKCQTCSHFYNARLFFFFTSSSGCAYPTNRWFQRINPTVSSWYSQTPTNVTADSESCSVHGQNGSLPTRRSSTRMDLAIRVRGAPPQRIRGFKSEHGLRNIGLDDGNCAVTLEQCNQLEVKLDYQ
jgi:hypothetical protein